MNVAHAIHGLGLGGAQKVVASILRGGDPSLRYFVYASEDGVHRQEIEEAGGTVRIIPRWLAKFDPPWIARLAWAMARDRIDLLHGHLFGDSLHGLLAARLRRLLGGRSTPTVLTLHIGPEGWNRLQRRAYPWMLASCDRAVACAESVMKNVEAAFPKAVRVMEAIPNGIEVGERPSLDAARRAELRHSLGVGDEAVVLSAVGRLSAQKGLHHLVDAVGRLVDDDPDTPARLVLLGEGELRQELGARAGQLGIADRVLFAGFRDNVPELLEVVDVWVSSALYEGLPIALLEAMAAGRAVVCTDIPGNLDAVRPDREALVVPTADPAAMAAALARAVADADLRRRLGEAARRRFEEKFTAAAMVERYQALYHRLVE